MKNLEECRTKYKLALTGLNAYYKNNEINYLETSLTNIEQSIKCPETRNKSIDLKISVLMLLKSYEKGYEFIDSLDDHDFNAKYKKNVTSNTFRALYYNSKSDTVKRNQLYRDNVENIQNYLQNEILTKDTLDEEAYLLLFTFKKELLGQGEIDAEIESLKEKYPLKKDDLDALKNTIRDSPLSDIGSAPKHYK